MSKKHQQVTKDTAQENNDVPDNIAVQVEATQPQTIPSPADKTSSTPLNWKVLLVGMIVIFVAIGATFWQQIYFYYAITSNPDNYFFEVSDHNTHYDYSIYNNGKIEAYFVGDDQTDEPLYYNAAVGQLSPAQIIHWRSVIEKVDDDLYNSGNIGMPTSQWSDITAWNWQDDAIDLNSDGYVNISPAANELRQLWDDLATTFPPLPQPVGLASSTPSLPPDIDSPVIEANIGFNNLLEASQAATSSNEYIHFDDSDFYFIGSKLMRRQNADPAASEQLVVDFGHYYYISQLRLIDKYLYIVVGSEFMANANVYLLADTQEPPIQILPATMSANGVEIIMSQKDRDRLTIFFLRDGGYGNGSSTQIYSFMPNSFQVDTLAQTNTEAGIGGEYVLGMTSDDAWLIGTTEVGTDDDFEDLVKIDAVSLDPETLEVNRRPFMSREELLKLDKVTRSNKLQVLAAAADEVQLVYDPRIQN